jgi:alanine dehydrogenase
MIIMIYLNNDDVKSLLSMKDCMQSIENIYKELAIGDATYRHRIDVYIPCGKDNSYFRWGTMEGGSRNTVFATRLKSDMVYWKDWEGGRTEEKYCVRPGLFCGFILLFSVENGEPLAMINDGQLQHMRVGACAGLGVKYLSRENASTVGMIGSGGMARSYLMAFCEVRKIKMVKVYSPTKANRDQYAEEMEKALSVEVEPVDDPQKAVRGSDIIATCTDSLTPVIKKDWVETGMHLTDVNGWDIPDDVIGQANVVVRLGEQTLYATVDKNKNRHSSSIDYMTHGIFSHVAGQPDEVKMIPRTKLRRMYQDESESTFLVDLISGTKSGRTTQSEITFFDNRGTQGLQFAAVGKRVLDLAVSRGIKDKEIPTAWFLQDIRD